MHTSGIVPCGSVMIVFLFSLAVLLARALQVEAVSMPHPTPPAMRRTDVSAVTQMTSTQLADLAPYTEFARASYCPSSIVTGWKCGQACEAVPGFQVSLAAGNGDGIPKYFVGYWPTENSVVVSHQGVDSTHLMADLTDINIRMERLDSSLFPGVDSGVEVHSGFANAQALTANIILNQAKSLISEYNANIVTLIGHSLGGAIAELDCVFMALNLPSNIAIKGVTYGTPRVGNPAWAALFDSLVPDFQRINNMKDMVPIVPGRGMGFSHVQGEVHIISPGNAVECPGDDDATDVQCTIASVPNVMEGNILDHLGPYEGIYIGDMYCT